MIQKGRWKNRNRAKVNMPPKLSFPERDAGYTAVKIQSRTTTVYELINRTIQCFGAASLRSPQYPMLLR